jgi:hypothetical protein
MGFELRGRDWCSWNSWARGLSGHTWPAYHGQCCGQARSSGCTARGRRSCRSLAARQAIVRREGRVDLGLQQDGGMTIGAASATSGWSRDDRRFPSSRLRSVLVHKRPGMDEETSLTLFLLQKELKAFLPFGPGAAKIRMANIYSRASNQGPTPNDAHFVLNNIIFILDCFTPLQFLPGLASSFVPPVTWDRLPATLSITIASPLEDCRVRGVAIARSPSGLGFENAYQVNWFPELVIVPVGARRTGYVGWEAFRAQHEENGGQRVIWKDTRREQAERD